MDHNPTQLDRELTALKNELIHMGVVVERMIDDAIAELVQRTQEKDPALRGGEQELNQLQIHIDRRILAILATRQPVATDLRFLMAATKINNDLERIGDLVVNITENVTVLIRQPELKPLIDIPRMAELSRRMVRQSIEAFLAGDTKLAEQVIQTDDEVDALKDQVQQELVELMKTDPAAVERAIALILISRHLERIGDHATNIAEDVVYAIQGKDIRHPLTPRSGEE